MDQQLLREFLADAEDLIGLLSGDVEALRAAHKGRERRALIAGIFRHTHTLKGAAATVELETIVRIAHEFEGLLDGIRLGRVRLDESVLAAFDEATRALAETLHAAARGEAYAPPLALIERLHALAQQADHAGASPEASQRILASLPPALAHSLSTREVERLREAAEDGSRLFFIYFNLDLATFDQQYRALETSLSSEGEIINTLPGTADAPPGTLGFQLLYATEENAARVAARVEPFTAATLEEIVLDALGEQDRFQDQFSEREQHAESAPLLASMDAPAQTMLRVELEEFDEAIYAAHELCKRASVVLERALASGGGERIERGESLDGLASDVRSRAFELAEKLIALRMIPVEHVLKRTRRAALLAARTLRKEIKIELAGEEVRLDKSVSDILSDPLLHLVRNAVDHGIETPAERAQTSKPERGLIRLQAFAEGGRVRLLVSDDGRGLDTERLTRAAREQGIIAPEASLDMRQALRLIFRPGFSTAAEVSSVSGRGVGLDVVERALGQVGGELRVRSERGAGTTFEILLPATLALVPAFLVQSGGQRYCLDASQVADACLLKRNDDEEQAHSSSTYRWHDEELPLVSLRGLLGQPPAVSNADGAQHLVVARFDEGPASGAEERARRAVAIIVDGWEGYRKALVRGLGRHASRWHGISGATELDDGTTALLLDLPGLLDQA